MTDMTRGAGRYKYYNTKVNESDRLNVTEHWHVEDATMQGPKRKRKTIV